MNLSEQYCIILYYDSPQHRAGDTSEVDILKIIGLTGPSGSGKGYVCKILAAHGIPSVDTDAVYHALLCPPSACLDELRSTFGDGVITAEGTLNRRALAAIVFSDKHRLAQLNAVTHKYILARTDVLLEDFRRQGASAAVVDAPALFESGYDAHCDFVIAVTADRSVRLGRIMARDGLTEGTASHRIDGQPTDDFYTSRAKYTVQNNGDNDKLAVELRRIMSQENILYAANT